MSGSIISSSMGGLGWCEAVARVLASVAVTAEGPADVAASLYESGAASAGGGAVPDPEGGPFVDGDGVLLVVGRTFVEASPRDAPAITEVSAAVCFEVFVPKDCLPWIESSVVVGILASVADVDVY